MLCIKRGLKLSNGQQKKDVYHFSRLSLERLGTCHVELQRLMHAVMNEQRDGL